MLLPKICNFNIKIKKMVIKITTNKKICKSYRLPNTIMVDAILQILVHK